MNIYGSNLISRLLQTAATSLVLGTNPDQTEAVGVRAGFQSVRLESCSEEDNVSDDVVDVVMINDH